LHQSTSRDAAQFLLCSSIAGQSKQMRSAVNLSRFQQLAGGNELPDGEPFGFRKINVLADFAVQEIDEANNRHHEQSADQSELKREPQPAHNRHWRCEEFVKHVLGSSKAPPATRASSFNMPKQRWRPVELKPQIEAVLHRVLSQKYACGKTPMCQKPKPQ
jgi:hypothetical protein